MVAFPHPSTLKPLLTLPASGGLAAGLAMALAVALVPTDLLEWLTWSSGVAALVPAAAAPLGGTARALLALGAGVAAGGVVWAALFLIWGPGGFLARPPRQCSGPSVRRADAHPDAPPRRPMTAADLGTPLMELPPRPTPPLPVEQPLPADLDQPLAAFDPGAIPAMLREPVRSPIPPATPLSPGERIEIFALVPPPPSVAPSRREADAPSLDQSIDALLRRLEEGAARLPRRATA